MKPRALHLCRVPDAAKTQLALESAGVEPVLVNAHPARAFEQVKTAWGPLVSAHDMHARLRSRPMRLLRWAFAAAPVTAGLALRASGTGGDLERLRERTGPIDFVLAHWGTGVLPELALLKRSHAFARVPAILNVETFPAAWSPGPRERFELELLRRSARYVDALWIPTQEMADLIARVAPELLRLPHRIVPFGFPPSFAGHGEPEIPADDEHDLIFTGWFDLTRSLNDVRSELRAFAEAGLRVHCSSVEGLEHANVRPFSFFGGEAFTSGEMASFARRFKASIVTYHVDASQAPTLRFQTSVPNRFLFSLAAGVPVVLPAGRFAAMERLIDEHGVGASYQSPEHAFELLRSPDWCAVQRRTFEARKQFQFDAASLRSLVSELTGVTWPGAGGGETS